MCNLCETVCRKRNFLPIILRFVVYSVLFKVLFGIHDIIYKYHKPGHATRRLEAVIVLCNWLHFGECVTFMPCNLVAVGKPPRFCSGKV